MCCPSTRAHGSFFLVQLAIRRESSVGFRREAEEYLQS